MSDEKEIDYVSVMGYLLMNGEAAHVDPILQIARNYEGRERIRKYKEHIDELIESGTIDLKEVNEMKIE